jgi:hypothetical protein
MLVIPSTAKRAGGIVVGVSSLTYLPAAAVTVYNKEVTKRNESS